MKILGISGSPRKGSNTSILVKRALNVCEKEGFETEFISLANFKIEFCDDCGYCNEKNNFRCSKEDDVEKILEKMIKADGLIIGSPTYFASISGKLKALFDRTLPLRRDNFKLKGKVGGAIAVGGSRNGGQEFAIREIQNWMLLHNILVVSDEKTAHFGGICTGRKEGDVLNDKVGLKTVENLALNICKTLKRFNL